MDSKKLGNFGEKIASQYLENKGYKILDKNYSRQWIGGPKKGEIDIVAKPRRNIFDILLGKKDNTIHFIEVKTLIAKNGLNFSPEEKVDFPKQRKLIKLAENWLRENKIPFESKWQIDVIGILVDRNSKKAKIRHFQNVVSSC